MGLRLAVLSCLLALVLPAAAIADPTDLDGSFTSSGVTSVDFSDTSYAEAVARQPDGKLLVVGGVKNGSNQDWAITRVEADGGKDTGPAHFGGVDGTAEYSEGGAETGAAAVAVESDGEIDVAGDANGNVVLRRFRNDGPVLARTLVPITNATDVTGRAIALQPDGKIVVAGTARVSGHYTIFLARFNADGSADTNFDNDGAAGDGVLLVDNATCDTGATAECLGESLGLVTSGGNITAIYVGGEARVDAGARLLRFKPAVAGQTDGFGLDSGFGAAGGVVKLAPTVLYSAGSLLVQPDGKVVLLGQVSAGASFQCGAVRRLGDGTVDSGFGTNGQAGFDGGGDSCSIADAFLGTDGRITFAGSRVTGSTATQVLGRLTGTGQPDTTFAPGGFAVAALGTASFANAIASVGGGRFVTAGGIGSPHKLYVARYQGGDRPGPSGGGGTTGGGTTDTGTTSPPPSGGGTPTEAPRPLGDIPYRSNADGSQLTRATPNSAVACDPGAWAGNPGFGYAWMGIPRNGPSQAVGSGRVFFLDDAAAARYQYVYCEVYGTNAAGAKLASGAFLPTVTHIRMPDVAGLSVPEAKRVIGDAIGAVRFNPPAGFAKKSIPDAKRGKVHAGDAFDSTPSAGKLLSVDGSTAIKVSISYYDPAKDADNDVAAPKTKKWGDDCPLRTHNADDERDLTNRILGKPAADARKLLTKVECPYEESITRKRNIEAQDPFVESVRTKSFDSGRGYVLDIVVPQFDDLAIVPYYVRLHGGDSKNGANFTKGELNPGIGGDGKLTMTLGGQNNDLCFRIIEASTGRLVQGATVTGVGTDNRPLATNNGANLVPFGRSTDDQGSMCGPAALHDTGFIRIDASYKGANGVNEDGTLSIPVIDRKRDVWETVDGRIMQCKGVCSQLGFTKTRAHAANVVDDLARALKGIVDRIFGAHIAQAELAGGDSSASLYQARERGGIEAGFLTLGGTLKPSLAPPGLISNDGGSLISNDGGSIISNDGGSIISDKGAGLISDKGAGIISNDGASIISNDGASIVAQGAGNIVAQGAGNLISNDGGSRRSAGRRPVVVAATDGRVLAGAALGLTVAPGGIVLTVGDRNVIFNANGTLAPGTIIRTGRGDRIPTLPSQAVGLDPAVLARSVGG